MRTITLIYLLASAFPLRAQLTPTLEDTDPVTLVPIESVVEAEMILYPNPANTTLRVLWGDRSLVRMPVEIRAMDGTLVRLDSLSPQHELEVSTLATGLYRLFLMDLGGVRAQATFQIAR